MNKNRYRIIFSKSKNMFIAVAENIKSHTKTAGQHTNSTQNNVSSEVHSSKSFHQLWQVKSIVASMSLFMAFSPVYAQMQADPSAAAHQQATIGVGKNQQGQNVPVINIQTPKNGVSHNVYNQFDVLQPGAVLNNSRNGAGSVIVGQVGANPYLQTGEARVILNEVNSAAASRFEGNLEVAGQRADVIIANPSGINIQGGGFINANKATFTTGKPQLNADGSIKQFIVDQGKITVSGNTGSNLGLGGNNNNAEYVDIYARAVEINAQLHAKNAINVVTGSNTISDDSRNIEAKTIKEKAPALAIDVKALGGMYADNIYIMGTEKGLGVTNAGTLKAVNNLVVTSAGKVEHSGTISSTSKTQGLIDIRTTSTDAQADITSTGAMNSYGLLNIDSGHDLNVKNKNISVNFDEKGTGSELILNSKGALNISSNVKVENLSRNGDLYINAQNINLAEKSNILSNGGSASVQADNNIVASNGSTLIAAKDLTIAADDQLKLTGNKLQATRGSIHIQSRSQTEDNKNLISIENGTINADQNLNIYGTGDVQIKDIGFTLDKDATRINDVNVFSGKNLLWDSSVKVLPTISGKVQLEAADKLNLKSGSNTLLSNDNINIQANQIEIDSNINTKKELNISANKGDLTLSKALTSTGNMNISAAVGGIKTSQLNAKSTAGNLNLLANSQVFIDGSDKTKSTITGVKGVTIASLNQGNTTVKNTNVGSDQGSILVKSNAQTVLKDASFDSKKNIELFAKDNLILDGVKSKSKQHTALNAKKNIYINSEADEKDAPIFISTKESQITADGILSVISEKNQNIQNAKLTGGAVSIEAGGALTTPKKVELNAMGSTLLKNEKKLNSLDGVLSIQTNNGLMLNPKIHTLKAKGDIELISKNGALTLVGHSGDKGNGSEQVVKLNTATGGIRLEGTKVDIQGSDLIAKKDISIISTKEDLMVDGVKNIFKEKSFYQIADDIKFNKTQMVNEYEKLKETKDYIDYKNKIDIANKNINIAVAGMMRVQGYSGLVFKTMKEDAEKEIAQLNINYQTLINSEKTIANKINTYESEIGFFEALSNGYEHKGANLNSASGNINITSAKGLSISGSNIEATTGIVNLEAQGVSKDQYVSATIKDGATKPRSLSSSIIVDGHTNFYDIGNESAENYRMKTTINPTIITGNKGVDIRAVGTTANDNLVLQGVGIESKNGNVTIEANKSILFDAAIEQSYDRSTESSKKKSWGGFKKKTTTTVSENNDVDAASVDIQAKNITIQNKDALQSNDAKTSIDIYSAKLNAGGGKISVRSAGDLNFLTVEALESSNVDVTKKSSFAGIKYNKSNTNTTRTQVIELPAKLKADYIGTKSGFDTRLVGTEFEYLKDATIESGGKIELLGAKSNITNLLKKEKNSVVWQSMQDKGSITETAQLPQFNGPAAPTFNAKGGLIVQVPAGEKDQNKTQLRDEILKLSDQPGNTYLKELVNRKDVDWQKVILTQKDWDYKSQGLTGPGAAIIVIIVTILTYGAGTATAAGATASGAAAGGTTVGMGASMIGAAGVTTTTVGGVTTITGVSTVGAMANAAVASLASQASVSLINNGGDIGKTVKDLGNKDSVKNLAASVATAGIMSKVGATLNLKPDSSVLSDRLLNNFATSVGATLVQTAVKGGNLEENLKTALLAGLAGTLQGELASYIGQNLDKVDPSVLEYTVHKIAHAAAGCAAAAVTKASCEAGAIGAGVGEIVAGLMIPEGKTALDLTDSERNKIKDTSKLIAGTTAAFAGYDVNTAANSANIAVENNTLGKLATTAGKAAYKVAKKISDLPPAARAKLKPSEIAEMLKKEGVQGIIDIGDNISTLVSPTSTPLDRALALIDLATGIDLKAGKKVDDLIKDKKIISQNASTSNSSISALKLRTELTFRQAGILTDGGKLTQKGINDSTMIDLADGVLRNPKVVKVLTKDGSNIADWKKFTTKSVSAPNGQNLQIHFYKNIKTGKIDYETQDYKVKGIVRP